MTSTRRVRHAHQATQRPSTQRGFVLLPVVLAITLIAAIAFLLNNQSVINVDMAVGQADARQADAIAAAGLAHATWGAQQSGCAGDMAMATLPFGAGNYTATVDAAANSTSSYTLNPDRDTLLRENNPDSNFGTDTGIMLGAERRGLISFDLSSVAAGSRVVSATLWLYVATNDPVDVINLHLVTAAWTETGATWNTMASNYDTQVFGVIPPQPAPNAWVAVNLTALAQFWVNDASTNHGLMLLAGSLTTDSRFSSREHYTAAQHPYLQLTTADGAVSPVTISASGTLTGNPTPANDISRALTRINVPAYQPAGYSFLQLQPGSGKDAMLNSFYNSHDYGDHELTVSIGFGSTREYSLLQFELSSIPPGARILSARLELYHYVNQGTPTNPGVDVHRLTRSWVEGTHGGTGTADGATWDTWDGSSNWASAGGDYDLLPVASSAISGATGDWESWEIGKLVQGWINGSYPNHGLILKGTGTLDVSFASREDADPTLHPKLNITYACECGSPCLAPQGSGTVAMVVVDPTNLVPADAYKKALFESWGYAVNPIGETTNASGYLTAAASNDVFYISETVNNNQVGPRIKDVPIGVVSEDGDFNSDLGFTTGSAWTVGSSINVTDTSHYITSLFPTGPLDIYTASMEQLTISGTPATGLQPLADSGGAGSLVVLDKGATMSGGGSAAGPRVMLPLGRNASFNWDYLNASGRLLVQRALQWGTGNFGAPLPNLLLVAAGTTPTAQEQLRIDLIDSWGYTVTLIDDNDSQANFDAAVSVNDVIYVSSTVSDAALGNKLKNAPIGVVNEQGQLVDEFGFGLQSVNYKTHNEIDVIENTHYITELFTTGMLTIVSADQTLHIMTANKGPGFDALAQVFNTGSLWDDSLGVIETGGELFGGGTAAGRRVLLPWGDATFDITALNADGLTLMQRAIEWAEGAGTFTAPIAHWKLDETSGIDAVDSAGGHDGTLTNGPNWGAGQLDGALNLDGNNDYIDVPHDDTLSLTTFSISAWIRPAVLSGWQIIVSKGNTTSWNYYLSTNDSEISIGFNNSGSWTEFLTSGAGLAADQWYHLAGTFDDAAGEGKVYLNGALIHTGTTTASPPANSDAVMIGNSPAGEYWSGSLDDVRIYDRVLGDAEIVELATGGSSPPQTVLLVVRDAASPVSMDAGRKSLMEGWGYIVTLIDDSDSQANFDAAAAAADVVYVSGTIVDGTLADKLTGSTTPIVNEFPGKLDNFGFCSTTTQQFSADTFTKSDAAHYISSPFGGSAINALTTFLQMPVPFGTLAPDLQVPAGFTSFEWAVVTLDSGATRWDGNPAPARRAHLPFAPAETTQLTADGQTIMQRAIEWAAGAGGGGGGGGGPTGVVFEAFTEASASGTSLVVNKPPGTAVGDLLVAAVATDGNTSASLAASGWNVINVADRGGAVTFGVWWKLAGASESSTYTFTWSGSGQAYGWIMRFTGHNPASPVDANSNDAGSGSAASSPSVTTTVDNALILRLGGFDDDDITAGDPGLSGHTAINMGDSGNGNATTSGGSGYVLQPAAGGSGTASFSLTSSEQYVTVTLGIAPAP